MNLDRLTNMVVNVVMRRLINTGINKGMGWFSRRAGTSAAPSVKMEARQSRQAHETAKRVRETAKIIRRLGR